MSEVGREGVRERCGMRYGECLVAESKWRFALQPPLFLRVYGLMASGTLS